MKTTKLFLLAAAILVSASVSGQSFGVKAGVNFSNMVAKDNDRTYSDNYNNSIGYHLGVTVESPITDLVSVESGLFYTTKGYNTTATATILGVTTKTDFRYDVNYIEIPVLAKVNYDVGGAVIFATAGPYLGYGLNGKLKSDITIGSTTTTSTVDLEWGDTDDDDSKRVDYGLSVGAGVKVNSVVVGVNYGMGLANLAPVSDNGYRVNNRVIGISVGFAF